MAKPRNLGDTELVVSEVVVQSFGYFPAQEAWTPAVNAYQTEGCFEVFVDLSGVDRESLDVRAQPGRLTIRGVRQPPQPQCEEGASLRILAMEIDAGPFKRVIALPRRSRIDGIESRYDRGLLWLSVPLMD